MGFELATCIKFPMSGNFRGPGGSFLAVFGDLLSSLLINRMNKSVLASTEVVVMIVKRE